MNIMNETTILYFPAEGSPIIIANPQKKKVVGAESLVDIEVGTNITTLAGKKD